MSTGLSDSCLSSDLSNDGLPHLPAVTTPPVQPPLSPSTNPYSLIRKKIRDVGVPDDMIGIDYSIFSIPTSPDPLTKQTTTSPTIRQLKRKASAGCSCTRSGCLKLYCECFTQQKLCVDCNCVNCENHLDNMVQRRKALDRAVTRHPGTVFDEEEAAVKNLIESINNGDGNNNSNAATTDDDSSSIVSTVSKDVRPVLVGSKALKFSIGCSCRRSNCSKRYCECYASGNSCSEKCRCHGCSNPFKLSPPSTGSLQNPKIRVDNPYPKSRKKQPELKPPAPKYKLSGLPFLGHCSDQKVVMPVVSGLIAAAKKVEIMGGTENEVLSEILQTFGKYFAALVVPSDP